MIVSTHSLFNSLYKKFLFGRNDRWSGREIGALQDTSYLPSGLKKKVYEFLENIIVGINKFPQGFSIIL